MFLNKLSLMYSSEKLTTKILEVSSLACSTVISSRISEFNVILSADRSKVIFEELVMLRDVRITF